MKTYSELAAAAGFTKAAENAEKDYELAKKLLVAYAPVTPRAEMSFGNFISDNVMSYEMLQRYQRALRR